MKCLQNNNYNERDTHVIHAAGLTSKPYLVILCHLLVTWEIFRASQVLPVIRHGGRMEGSCMARTQKCNLWHLRLIANSFIPACMQWEVVEILGNMTDSSEDGPTDEGAQLRGHF